MTNGSKEGMNSTRDQGFERVKGCLVLSHFARRGCSQIFLSKVLKISDLTLLGLLILLLNWLKVGNTFSRTFTFSIVSYFSAVAAPTIAIVFVRVSISRSTSTISSGAPTVRSVL